MHVITTRSKGGFLLSGQSMESLERQTETTHRATASNDAVMLHMVCGKIASGKSTLTATLASAERTIPISEDDWLARLYPGEILSIDDYVRCATRIKDVIADHVRAVLQAGVPVVLDLPFNTVAARAWGRAVSQPAGASLRPPPRNFKRARETRQNMRQVAGGLR
ncbi:ATP-binding protein [Burkholderia sp. MS455]|uniref:AAA family ATPase n=1 Tax=Burkholderia sp. MS455 TaxID=2811788 RepID=UPI001EF56DDE|nr:ATP-binding protein [Burkholderia sp. MS455]